MSIFVCVFRRLMENKKIVVAVTPEVENSCLFDFLENNLKGERLHISLCLMNSAGISMTIKARLSEFIIHCDRHGISTNLNDFEENSVRALKSHSAFSDLLIMLKSSLKPLSFEADFGNWSCPMMAVPDSCTNISNIILSLDENQKSLRAIKEFYQIFSNQLNPIDTTLLQIEPELGSDFYSPEESMLIDYIKRHHSNLGVLKVQEPLTKNSLRPIEKEGCTLVVGSSSFLMSRYGEQKVFRPFYDEQSAVFISALFE